VRRPISIGHTSSPNAPPGDGSDLASADLAAGEFLDRAFFRSLVGDP
jgi:hypothetical protein